MFIPLRTAKKWFRSEINAISFRCFRNFVIYLQQLLCSKYQKLANMEKYVLFGGRLADYKYYNMDEVIEKSLSLRFS